MTDWQREYRNLVSSLWRGYQVYSSAGATNAAFERHVWPVIAEARKRLRDEQVASGRAYAVGFKDELGAYGMVYGPTPTLRECLDFEPILINEQPCYVIEFTGDGPNGRNTNRVVARWNKREMCWIERKPS